MADLRRPAAHRLARVWRNPATAPVAVFVAGAAGAAYLYGTNPHEGGQWLPRCPFRLVTGLLCPACGGTRMVYDLMHGDVAASFADNRALFLVAPFALGLLAYWAVEGLRGRRWRPRWSRRTQAVVLSTAVAWTVVRNVM
ncbi:DUF2752 domain-containing protein [Streptomyces sp. NPDC048057]|uniref:DUF2752 domain-containing protein n=1 Tax=Streptomyces sp. NPDC048057 TaxID=3155628 RepID=UPI0033C7DA89